MTGPFVGFWWACDVGFWSKGDGTTVFQTLSPEITVLGKCSLTGVTLLTICES